MVYGNLYADDDALFAEKDQTNIFHSHSTLQTQEFFKEVSISFLVLPYAPNY